MQPSSYLRRARGLSRPMPPVNQRPPETAVDREQQLGLVRFSHICISPQAVWNILFSEERERRCVCWCYVKKGKKLIQNLCGAMQRRIRAFLKARTSYDVLPLSFRLIVFDTSLLVKSSLNILIQNGKCLVAPTDGSEAHS